ncbi:MULTISPECIES: GntR family transcriptional regulator [unclassified Streptomyces]|uniref:GntR family transcriptional regulator n=1 Tax=unclassified Streptomyces TaxID=2593676 RepID=UPI00380A4A47
METLRPVRRTLLRDTAYEAIRDAIVRGDIPPGAPVRDADLAERLGLSRAPVRDALSRLSGEGLVESKPQSYTRVTRLVPRDVRDAAAVVQAMQELAARTAVPLLTDPDITAMREANDRFRDATLRGDVADALRADDRLHGVLVTACGNRAVAATVERYTPLIRRLEWRRFNTASAAHGSAELHDRLIEACAGRDADAAARVTADIWRALEELADELSVEPSDERGAGQAAEPL